MAEKLCPQFREACLEHRCRWYIQLHGVNPQTGAPLPNDGFGCAVEYLPVLLIENAQQTRQHAAAVESARNESAVDARTVAASVTAMADEVGHMARAVAAPELPANHHSLAFDLSRTATARIGLFGRLKLAFKGDR